MKSFAVAVLTLVAAAVCSPTRSMPLTLREVEGRKALGYHLLSLAPTAEPVWKTRDEIDALRRKKIRFIDLTDVYNPDDRSLAFAEKAAPSGGSTAYRPPSHQREVRHIISKVSIPSLKAYLTHLSSYPTRYYETQTGADASIWIRDTVQKLIRKTPGCGASVSLFPHSWVQNSIIAKIPGRLLGPVSIISAHMDSINDEDPFNGLAPGTDDNGSGSVDLLEAFRLLLEANFRPETPVEFHWYAAEEGGLRGSVDISAKYKNENVQVKGVVNFDMTAFVKPGTVPTVGIITDYTNANLNVFVIQLIETYTNMKWGRDACGYGCSDHAAWNRTGFPSSFPLETRFDNYNENVHTANDTAKVEGFSWEHIAEFARLAIAFAYESGN